MSAHALVRQLGFIRFSGFFRVFWRYSFEAGDNPAPDGVCGAKRPGMASYDPLGGVQDRYRRVGAVKIVVFVRKGI